MRLCSQIDIAHIVKVLTSKEFVVVLLKNIFFVAHRHCSAEIAATLSIQKPCRKTILLSIAHLKKARNEEGIIPFLMDYYAYPDNCD